MVKKKDNKEFADEAINNYLRKAIDGDKIKKEMSDFKSSIDKFSNEDE